MAILTIQPSNIDTYLYEGGKGTNFGLLTYVEVRIYNDGEEVKTSRPILKFDFSALPANATITAATLNLYFYAHTIYDAAGRTYWAYELTQTEWVEAEATWNSYKTGSTWAAAGGDYTTTNGASVTVPAHPNWTTWDVLALVQHFQSTHANVAHFLIKDNSETGGAQYDAEFYSREYIVNTTLCPKLIITYTPPDAAVWLRRITINRDKSPRIWKRKEI